MNFDEKKPEQFSNDPEEQLRIENEILKLKLRAELGGEMHEFEKMPAELENMFLNNVLAYEHAFANAEETTIYQLLSQPSFTPELNISEDELPQHLQRLEELMLAKNIEVSYETEITQRQKYLFLTEELFRHTTTFVNMPGMMVHYSYEEFHPNHELEIRKHTERFLEDFFEQDFSEYSSELAHELLSADGAIHSRESVVEKLQNISAAYTRLYNCGFVIAEIKVDLNEGGDTGFGFSEGSVKYDAVLESGETLSVKEPFKLYFQYSEKWWNIFFFYWPGFEW